MGGFWRSPRWEAVKMVGFSSATGSPAGKPELKTRPLNHRVEGQTRARWRWAADRKRNRNVNGPRAPDTLARVTRWMMAFITPGSEGSGAVNHNFRPGPEAKQHCFPALPTLSYGYIISRSGCIPRFWVPWKFTGSPTIFPECNKSFS